MHVYAGGWGSSWQGMTDVIDTWRESEPLLRESCGIGIRRVVPQMGKSQPGWARTSVCKLIQLCPYLGASSCVRWHAEKRVVRAERVANVETAVQPTQSQKTKLTARDSAQSIKFFRIVLRNVATSARTFYGRSQSTRYSNSDCANRANRAKSCSWFLELIKRSVYDTLRREKCVGQHPEKTCLPSLWILYSCYCNNHLVI